MATLREIVTDIQNIMRGGQLSDDEAVSYRQVAFWVHNTRAKLIREDLMKGRAYSSNIIQSIGCLEVETVDATNCCGVTVDCDVYRSALQLPTPIETDIQDLITKVAPVGIGQRPFHLIPVDRVPYIGHGPFNSLNNSPKAVYENGYIYIFVPTNDKVITRIYVEGIFADPTALREFATCDGASCYTDDSPYPISDHMIETLKQIVLTTNVKFISSAPSDNSGNANFEVQPNITK